jgi:hypothetical protein
MIELLHKDDKIFNDQRLYQEATGSLNYLATISRPDISFAVSKACSFNSRPTESSWNLVKRIFCYLIGTENLVLTFQKDGNNDIEGFVDSDWATNLDNRKSTTGYVFKFAGAAIAWMSKGQKTVALSSTKAEFMALGLAASEAMFLRNITSEIMTKIFRKV